MSHYLLSNNWRQYKSHHTEHTAQHTTPHDMQIQLDTLFKTNKKYNYKIISLNGSKHFENVQYQYTTNDGGSNSMDYSTDTEIWCSL